MREGEGRDTNVYDFFVIPVCLFVAFESMSLPFPCYFIFKPSRKDNSNWIFHQIKMPPTIHRGLTH